MAHYQTTAFHLEIGAINASQPGSSSSREGRLDRTEFCVRSYGECDKPGHEDDAPRQDSADIKSGGKLVLPAVGLAEPEKLVNQPLGDCSSGGGSDYPYPDTQRTSASVRLQTRM